MNTMLIRFAVAAAIAAAPMGAHALGTHEKGCLVGGAVGGVAGHSLGSGGNTNTLLGAAAEQLFMEHGFEATSLRQLTTAASVNLAAVNYHFGSKEELFQAVLTRRLDPMNQERIELLEKVERDAGGRPLSCEKILFAMLIPALRLARDERRGGKNFLRLLGRAYADPAPFI